MPKKKGLEDKWFNKMVKIIDKLYNTNQISKSLHDKWISDLRKDMKE